MRSIIMGGLAIGGALWLGRRSGDLGSVVTSRIVAVHDRDRPIPLQVVQRAYSRASLDLGQRIPDAELSKTILRRGKNVIISHETNWIPDAGYSDFGMALLEKAGDILQKDGLYVENVNPGYSKVYWI